MNICPYHLPGHSMVNDDNGIAYSMVEYRCIQFAEKIDIFPLIDLQ